MNPTTTIVLMGILPWGLVDQDDIYVWPNEYIQGIATVNGLIQAFAAGQSNVHYVDCGHQLFPTGQVSCLGQPRLLECLVSICHVAARSQLDLFLLFKDFTIVVKALAGYLVY